MRCERCGVLLEERYYDLHKRQFCQPRGESFREKLQKSKLMRVAFGIWLSWSAYWIMVLILRFLG